MDSNVAESGVAGLLPQRDGAALTGGVPVAPHAPADGDGDQRAEDLVDNGAPAAGGLADQRHPALAPERVWKRNERLVYLINFLHMTMMTCCLGSVWDNFVYQLSEDAQDLVRDPIWVGPGIDPWPSRGVHTESDFVLSFDVWPSSDRSVAHAGCEATFTCATSILHITDGSGNGDCCAVGNRVPAIYFLTNSTQLHLMMDAPGQPVTADHRVYDKSQMCIAGDELEVEAWSRVKVKQCDRASSKGELGEAGSGGALMLFVNGKKKCEINSTRAAPVHRMRATAFFGSLHSPLKDTHVPAHVQLRNMRYSKPASNTYFGLVNSVQGVAGLILMYPIGWLGDRTNRYSLLRMNMGLGFVAAMLIIMTIWLQSQVCLFLGILVWAGYQQCLSSTIYAALSDNVRKGERTRASVNYKTLSAISMAFGPAIQLAVLLLAPSTDEWTLSTFMLLLTPGWVILLGVALACHCMTPVGFQISALPNADDVPRAVSPRLSASGREVKEAVLTASFLDDCVVGSWKRRYVVAVSAQVFFIFTLLANGMSVRYFNLYYTQVLRFQPAQLCLLNAACRIWVAICVQLISRGFVWVGRTNLVVVLHILAATCTLGIYGGGFGVPPLWVSCGCYLLRYGFLQARDPLLYALTMDIVPVEQRGRWAALNSLRTLSFSGSALIGGLLADSRGYEFSFQVTVVSLLCSTVLFFPAWFAMPRREGAGRTRAADGEGRESGEAQMPRSPEPRVEREALVGG